MSAREGHRGAAAHREDLMVRQGMAGIRAAAQVVDLPGVVEVVRSVEDHKLDPGPRMEQPSHLQEHDDVAGTARPAPGLQRLVDVTTDPGQQPVRVVT